MQPPWKLVVEDLGRIAHAEIEARPLLLFVGGNNTGKTYLASLLWGLGPLSMRVPLAHGDAHQRCVAWLEERFGRREQEAEFELGPKVYADLVQIASDTLQEEAGTIPETTFNRPGFKVGRFELRPPTRGRTIPMRWGIHEHEGRSEAMLYLPDGMGIGAQNEDIRAGLIDVLVRTFVLGILSMGLLGMATSQLHPYPVFLPASRTGFMLLYRSLAQQLVPGALIKTSFPRPPVPDLTAPAIDFVSLLMGFRPDSLGAFPDEAAFLERAIGGRFSLRSDMGLNEVLYEHTEGEPALPMQLSSSLVTELAPVVLTLRHVGGYRVIIIEEPEAHLHPHLQRVLAQVIVRLIRKGLFVWITTHSENFCQQINNFLKIGALPPDKRAAAQEKLKYAETDYLDLDDVGGYEFKLEGSRTVVEALRKTPQGLAMPTFNRELFALAKEMDYLDDLVAEGT
jgi:hypothetical protein